tara:strand:+ start:205 stop:609 length:405 start_codon:yes stop_codon:yes gene_type:complete
MEDEILRALFDDMTITLRTGVISSIREIVEARAKTAEPEVMAAYMGSLANHARHFADVAEILSAEWDESLGITDSAGITPDLEEFDTIAAAEYIGCKPTELMKLRDYGRGPDYACIRGKFIYGLPDLQLWTLSL